MRYLRVLLLGAAIMTAGPATGVEAADFVFPREPAVPVPAPIPIPEYSGWYLRGDIAWSHNESPNLSQAGVPFTGEKIDDIGGFGAGVGYYFSDSIRGDITVDYRRDADVSGNTGTSTHTAGLSSTVVLANLYFDLVDRDRLAPYVGVGLGFSRNQTDGRTITSPASTTGGDDKTSFAISAMAGFSYRIKDSLLLDAGYRYLYLGNALTGIGGAPGALEIEDIRAHEWRIGVRYEIN